LGEIQDALVEDVPTGWIVVASAPSFSVAGRETAAFHGTTFDEAVDSMLDWAA
jgi:hypothetical protein